MHGYELHQHLTETTGLRLVWRIKQSQLYALLTRLEERGYLSTTLETQEARPPRKIHTLTPAGRSALEAWLRTPVPRGRDFRLEFLAKVYFARQQDQTTLHELLTAQECIFDKWLAELQNTLDTLDPTSYEALVYHFRVGQVQAMLTWLKELKAIEPGK
ncbi:MAG: PadR family transcriptional regulator [Anaerolineae bacterium]|nr:PadR family transcriptional regulator [Anaerolineae bacterium]